MSFCESCEQFVLLIEDPCDDPVFPYRVCPRCHRRLISRSLRPREWFNLSKRHGWWNHLLHEDFYDQDGIADQPLSEVVSPEDHPAPTLTEMQGEMITLLDYSITRWDLDSHVLEAWRAFAEAEVLGLLRDRFSSESPNGFKGTLAKLAVSLYGASAVDFVEAAWQKHRHQFGLWTLARLSAKCMSRDDALDRVLPALEALSPSEQRDSIHCLEELPSPRVLDWVEAHAGSPVVGVWGEVAAVSDVPAATLRRWIKLGRPLSLVAIDALFEQISRTEQGIGFFEWRPKVDDLLRDLIQMRSADPVPRV